MARPRAMERDLVAGIDTAVAVSQTWAHLAGLGCRQACSLQLDLADWRAGSAYGVDCPDFAEVPTGRPGGGRVVLYVGTCRACRCERGRIDHVRRPARQTRTPSVRIDRFICRPSRSTVCRPWPRRPDVLDHRHATRHPGDAGDATAKIQRISPPASPDGRPRTPGHPALGRTAARFSIRPDDRLARVRRLTDGLPEAQRQARVRLVGESWSEKAAEFERLVGEPD